MEHPALSGARLADHEHEPSLPAARQLHLGVQRAELRRTPRVGCEIAALHRGEPAVQSRFAEHAVRRHRRRIRLHGNGRARFCPHERRHEPVAIRAQEDCVGFRRRRQPRGGLHRRTGDGVAPGPVAQPLGDDRPRMQARLKAKRDPLRGNHDTADLPYAGVQLERGAHCAQVVVFVSGGDPEERHDLLANRLVDDAAMPAHRVDGGRAHTGDHVIDLRRREPLDERRVPGNHRHQHDRPSPLSRRRKCQFMITLRDAGGGRRRIVRRRDAWWELTQFGQELVRIRVPPGQVFAHRPRDDGAQGGRRGRPQLERNRLDAEDGGNHVGRGGAVERRTTRNHLVEQDAEAPEVAARVDLEAAGLLRRHVARRAHHHPGVRAKVQPDPVRRPFRRGELGEPEVEDLHVAVRAHHDVVRLDVAMDEAARMRGRERTGDLDADVDGLARRQRPPLQPLAERLALDELGHHVGPAVQFAEVVDDQNMRVVQAGRRTRFLMKAAQPVAVGRELRREELDRHRPIQLGIVREIDLAHSARTEPRRRGSRVHRLGHAQVADKPDGVKERAEKDHVRDEPVRQREKSAHDGLLVWQAPADRQSPAVHKAPGRAKGAHGRRGCRLDSWRRRPSRFVGPSRMIG